MAVTGISPATTKQTKQNPEITTLPDRILKEMFSSLHHSYNTTGASSVLVSAAPAGLPASSVVAAAAAANDCSKSPMISSICSVPTEMRIRSC